MLLDTMFIPVANCRTCVLLRLAGDGDLNVAARAASGYSRHGGWFVWWRVCTLYLLG